MFKKLTATILFSLLMVSVTMAQQGSVTGEVVDGSTGEPLPGVNVVLIELGQGVATDADGQYTLTGIPTGSHTLRASFVGYVQYETVIEVTEGELVHDIQLEQDVLGLEDIVVTAFGIQREQRSLGYASQSIDAGNLAQSQEANFVTSLQGKIAGAEITNAGSSLGSSTRIVLRGVSSLSGDNQPLFVVDGVYIDNSSFDRAGEFGGIDYGNAAMDINPDNIQSITVLKGPNAAALYGSRAANGAIIITTKDGSGVQQDGIGVTVNSTTTFEDILVLPDLQNEYGQGLDGQFSFVDGRGNGTFDGVDESWGPPLDGRLIPQWWSNGEPVPWVPSPNNIHDYFNVGTSFHNNISFGGSYGQSNFYLSYTNLHQTGLFPNERLGRNTIALNAGSDLTDRFRVEGRINYIETDGRNRPGVGYNGDNPMQQLTQWFGRQIDTNRLRDYADEDGRPRNWNYNYFDNPFWIQYENGNSQQRNRIMGNVQLRYDLADWATLRGMTGADVYEERRTDRVAVHTINDPDGYYAENARHVNEWTANLQLNVQRDVSEDFYVDFNAGAETQRRVYNMQHVQTSALSVPNLYSITNAALPPDASDNRSEKQVNSLFGAATIGFRDYVYLDLTGRNDWSSTLPVNNNSYFYPSVSLSLIFTDAFDFGEGILTYGKIRGGWTQVGNDTDPYQLEATYISTDRFGDVPTFTVTNTLPNADLKPERTESFELGTELRFFGDRASLDVTYYTGSTRDQILPVQISRATGYDQQIVNAGKISNEGIEVALGATPVRTADFAWDFTLNWATNSNTVDELAEGLDTYVIGSSWDVTVEARPGEEFGTLYGLGFARDDDGNILTSGGYPIVDSEQQSFGSYQPDWTGGWRNTFSYKGLSLSSLIDVKKGGVLSSVTYMFGRYTGILEETLEGRECDLDTGEGCYVFDGGRWADGAIDADTGEPNAEGVRAQDFNATFFGNAESHIFDASYVKLRELRLTYQLPESLLRGLPVTGASLGIVGNNLWIIYKAAPHIDPETAFNNGNLQGLESNQFPSARSIGFNVRLTL